MYYDNLKRRVRAAVKQKRLEREALDAVRCIDLRQHIADVYKPLHEDIKAEAHTTYNLPGGRGSAKSTFAGFEIVDGIMQDETGLSNAIVFRYVGNTLRDSAFAQISWCIDALGVGHLWESRVSPMQFTYLPTGAQIVFRGLDDAGKLKSIKPRRGAFKYIWFEEFSELPGPNFVRSVMQSVQRGGYSFIVFRTFNPPISQNNWANLYINEPDERALTLHTNYTDIPREWLGEAFLYEAERLKEINPRAYEHEYMGIPTGSGGEVFPNIEVRTITETEVEQLEYIYQGLDFGFAVDPACFVRVAYDRRKETIYFLDEIYQRHCSNAKMAELIKEKGYDDARITADSAEPKSIVDMRGFGLSCVPCYKYPGCVLYRVRWLQQRKIIIDPKRTPNAYKEFTGYCYATDKDGNLLAELVDADNHSIDAVAYALDRVIYKKANPA